MEGNVGWAKHSVLKVNDIHFYILTWLTYTKKNIKDQLVTNIKLKRQHDVFGLSCKGSQILCHYYSNTQKQIKPVKQTCITSSGGNRLNRARLCKAQVWPVISHSLFVGLGLAFLKVWYGFVHYFFLEDFVPFLKTYFILMSSNK